MQSGIGSLVCSETRHRRNSIFWGLAPWRCPLTTTFAAAMSIRRRQASSKQGLKALKSQKKKKKERKKEVPSLMDGSFYFGKDDDVISRNPNIIQSIICWPAWSCLIQQTFKARKTHAKTWTLYMVSITAPPWHSMGKKWWLSNLNLPPRLLFEKQSHVSSWLLQISAGISQHYNMSKVQHMILIKKYWFFGVSYSMRHLAKKIIMINY